MFFVSLYFKLENDREIHTTHGRFTVQQKRTSELEAKTHHDRTYTSQHPEELETVKR